MVTHPFEFPSSPEVNTTLQKRSTTFLSFVISLGDWTYFTLLWFDRKLTHLIPCAEEEVERVYGDRYFVKSSVPFPWW